MASIERRGPKRWRARVRAGEYNESKTFRSRAEAMRWAQDVEEQIKYGRYYAQRLAETTTLGMALERYSVEVSPKKKSFKSELCLIRLILEQEPRLCAKPLMELMAHDIAGMRDRLLEAPAGRNRRKRSGSTVNHYLALLSHVFTVAIKDWGMETLDNPVSRVRKCKQPPGRDRRLRGDEEARLLAAAREFERDELATLPIGSIISFAIATGMRAGEIAALKWEYIDLEAFVITLPAEVTKTSRIRSIPISRLSEEVLIGLGPKETGSVFEVRHDGHISAGFRKVCDRAGIVDLRFHDLRHEFTSRMLESGEFNHMQVALMTGHQSLQMLKRYAHLEARILAKKMRGEN